MLTHLSLFSGIGGLDLAAEWAGFETVGQCEFADYPTKVLEKHWPDVPRWRDIRTLTKESFYERTGLRTVDIISGGFPCQPFSVAGKQKGKGDDRYLWPEMLRVIRELSPRWVLGENVPGILRIAGKTVCEDLEREGYAVTVLNFEAAAVGAPHRRERVFFLANNTNSAGEFCGAERKLSRQEQSPHARGICEDVPNAQHDGQSTAEVARSTDTGSNASQTRQSATVELEGCGCRRAGSYDVANACPERLQTERPEQQTTGIAGSGEDVANTKSKQGPSSIVPRACTEEQGKSGRSGCQVGVLPNPHDTTTTRQREHSGEIHTQPEPERFSSGGCEGWRATQSRLGRVVDGVSPRLDGHWRVEPDIPRVATGVKNRVDRLKCLGNAVVPQQAYPIFAAIAEIERGKSDESAQ